MISDNIDIDPTTLTQEQIDNAALVIVEILSIYMKNRQHIKEAVNHAS